MWYKIKIVPRSLNNRSKIGWHRTKSGKKKAVIVKDKEYAAYCEELFYLIPIRPQKFEGKLKIYIVLGMSDKRADSDNQLKGIIDAISKRWKFDDVQIFLHDVMKINVPRGEEFVAFKVARVSEESYEKKVAKFFKETVDIEN